jgi:hypothetical protein
MKPFKQILKEAEDKTPSYFEPSGNDIVSNPLGDPFNNPLNINPWDPNFVGPHDVNPGTPFYHDDHWWFFDGEAWWFQDSFGGWWWWDGSNWNRNDVPIGDDENNPTLDQFDPEEYLGMIRSLDDPDVTYDEALRMLWLAFYRGGEWIFSGEYDDDGRPIFTRNGEDGRYSLEVHRDIDGSWTWSWHLHDQYGPDRSPLYPDLEDTSTPDELLRWMDGEGWFGIGNRR